MKFLGKADKTVSRQEVVWCYRSLLGREPESEAAILQHLQAKNFKVLVECFVESPEFAENRLVGNAEVSREDVIWCYRNLLRAWKETDKHATTQRVII